MRGLIRGFCTCHRNSIPWATYGLTESGQLLVEASVGPVLSPDPNSDEILQIAQVVENWEPGVLGIEFAIFDDGDDNNNLLREAANDNEQAVQECAA